MGQVDISGDTSVQRLAACELREHLGWALAAVLTLDELLPVVEMLICRMHSIYAVYAPRDPYDWCRELGVQLKEEDALQSSSFKIASFFNASDTKGKGNTQSSISCYANILHEKCLACERAQISCSYADMKDLHVAHELFHALVWRGDVTISACKNPRHVHIDVLHDPYRASSSKSALCSASGVLAPFIAKKLVSNHYIEELCAHEFAHCCYPHTLHPLLIDQIYKLYLAHRDASEV